MNLAAWIESLGWDAELCGRLCLVLAHSLWQIALLAALATFVARVWKNATPERIYALYAGALLVGLLALPLTLALTRLPGESVAFREALTVPRQQISPAPNAPSELQMPVQQAAPPVVASAPPALPTAVQMPPQATATSMLAWAPWLVGCYVVGVTAMLLRLICGLWQNYRLSVQATPIAAGPLVETLQRLARTWSLRVTPALACTQRVIVPQVVGLWRPVILLPAAALAGLRPDELEMILAHELAHVRRYDLWMNLVQRLAEAVLFFNPAVWYLSRRVSLYREYCCDEATCRLAQQTADDTRLRYAEALLRAVELSKGAPQGQKLAALAASGSRPSELRRRVARLFGEPLREPVRISRTGLVALLVGVAILAMIPMARQNAAETETKAKPKKETTKPTVEVLGIGTFDQKPQQWWDAEGKLLKDVPFHVQGASVTGEARQLVFQIADLPKDADVTWGLSGCRGYATGGVVLDGQENPFGYFSNVFAVKEDSPVVKLRVGIAAGEWKTVTTAKGIGSRSMSLPNGKNIAFAGAFTEEDRYSQGNQATSLVVSHNFRDMNVRLVVVDKSGKIYHSSSSASNGVGSVVLQTKYSFRDLLPDDIDRFEFQTREYEWTEIKDLPVEPGEKKATMEAPKPMPEKLGIRPPNQAEWIEKLRALTDHNPTAFSIGPQMIAELSPQEAREVVRAVWPQIKIDEVKTGLLKAFEFARHPKVLDVLDLGATDNSKFVREYAYSYLQNYALRDFKQPEHDYQSWQREFANKTTDEVLAANCQWFVDQLRSQPPITDPQAWQEVEMMLELSGSKSSYPQKAEYLRKAGLPEVLRSWRDQANLDDTMKRSITTFLGKLDKTLGESLSYENIDLSGRNLAGLVLQGNVDGLFMNADLSKVNLSDATIVGGFKAFSDTIFAGADLTRATLIGRAAFQSANFVKAVLQDANLKGDTSAFQRANFNDADLRNSRLTGGSAAFQGASLNNADLQGARLQGGSASFQMANFDNANLTDAEINCTGMTAFQVVSLNGTNFSRANISAIDPNALASCKFDAATPPRYDEKTKFPEGFDPHKHGWVEIKAESGNESADNEEKQAAEPTTSEPPAQLAADSKYTLKVRPLLENLELVPSAYLTLWREAAPDEKIEPVRQTWTDTESQTLWVRQRSAHPNDGRHGQEAREFEFTELPPGRYCVTAATYQRKAAVPDPTPFGVSRAVLLDVGEGTDTPEPLDVVMAGNRSLTVRILDEQTGKPIEGMAVRLFNARGVPIVHGHGSGNFFERTSPTGEVHFRNLPNDEYRIDILGRYARVNEFIEYKPFIDSLRIQLVGPGPQTVTYNAPPHRLSDEEIAKRFPFSVHGRVTDVEGHPLADVEVRAATGIGTLWGGGSVRTDEQGEYRLHFGPGMLMSRDDAPQGVGVQAARFFAKKPGWYEVDLNGGGDFLMSDLSPTAQQAEITDSLEDWGGKTIDKMVFPDQPREVNFTLAPAATLRGKLLSESGRELEGNNLYLIGEELPFDSNVFAQFKTDDDGEFEVEDVPVGRPWRLSMSVPSTRHEIATQTFTLESAGVHECEVALAAEKRDGDTVAVTLSYQAIENEASQERERLERK
jgi:beta-lactamase regulating signal transducer with metallopeptidase domain/uncharacterized protein YjbI with pentapeptide repeats